MTPTNTERFERRVLLLMAMVQFINIWDFMIVMPLGPDLAKALHVDTSHLGWIVGSYSIAAAIVGVVSASFLDRFDRRHVLLFNLSGLAVITLSMVLANNLTQLIIVRILTGMFGGPVFASSMAVIADTFPEQRRGEALGKVFGSYSVASVIGVPLGLEIARLFGWWAPFVAVATVATVTVIVIGNCLPPLRHHLDHPHPVKISLFTSVRHNAASLPACILVASSLFASFLIIPNISAHVQQNLGYPRAWLGLLYFSGGIAAFFSMRFVGRQSDRIGYAKTSLLATFGLCAVLYVGFYAQMRAVPVLAIFVMFMLCMSTRNVTSNALISKIPRPHERAGFMSLISALQHLMAGLGAMCATMMLTETADHHLAGMDRVTLLAMGCMLVAPLAMFRIEKRLAVRKPATLVPPLD